jgi:glycosyltransferase involved in cell wall biosynthesis
VLTVSDFSKREIVRWLGVAPEDIEVVYSGATPFATPSSEPAPPAAPLVLYVGSVFARRHVPELMAGFARMAARHPDARLAIVGDDRSRPPVDLEAVAEATGQRERIGLHRYVSDDELARLYASAGAFAFLSEYEGFGLTPLDALAAGVPIVVLDTEVAREIYGPAAVYVAEPEPALVEAALERVLFDDGERARLRVAAATILGRYSWRACAQRTLQILLAAK